jgi:nitrite reductase/ring-hydroxylating ferredoxin subunit
VNRHPFPRGWFWLSWSYDLAPGDVRPVRAFGTDLVLFRNETGAAVVLDAHCAHLGAHLGHGGRVCGEDIVCPFHGWSWSPSGANTSIPYTARGPRNRTMRSWPVHEAGGIVSVWFDPDGAEPTWSPLAVPEVDDVDYHPLGPSVAAVWRGRRVAPENPVENVCDAAHLKFVHGSGSVPTMIRYEAEGPYFRSVLEYHFGEGYERTWLTPDGPVLGRLEANASGLGLNATRYSGIREAVQIFGVTPVDPGVSDVWSAVLVRRASNEGDRPDRQAQKMAEHFNGQFEADFPIWENLRYVEHPPFVAEEAKPMDTVRRWIDRFYRTEAEASNTATLDKAPQSLTE